jgi:quercetin dioxygenase-like cupin family protein
MKRMIPLVVAVASAAICAAQSEGAKVLVLEKNEGEARVRRPRGSLPAPTAEFILKVTPENSGSKQLVLGTEDIPPGGVIPKHEHLEQDEILLVQTGAAHVTLDDKEYDVHAGGIVFFSGSDWVSLKNVGTDGISLVFIFSAPAFEKNMRCGSVPAGQTAPPINTDELKACAHEGHVRRSDPQQSKVTRRPPERERRATVRSVWQASRLPIAPLHPEAAAKSEKQVASPIRWRGRWDQEAASG